VHAVVETMASPSAPQTPASPIFGAGAAEVAQLVDDFKNMGVADEDRPKLNPEQERALNLAVQGKNVFITGVGGTGKSVLLREMRERLEKKDKVVAIAAPTGLAAEAIQGATIHSVAGVGVPKTISGFGYLNQFDRSRIKKYDVLMIDEVSMVSGEMFDRLSEHFSAVRGYDVEPFGGLQIILFGDFLQLGPIDETKKRTDKEEGFCPALFLNRGWAFESWSWQDLHLESVELMKVFRQQDEAFVDVLRRIRRGDKNAHAELMKMHDAEHRRESTGHERVSATTLVATNDEADRINTEELRKLKGKPQHFRARDSVEVDENLGPEDHVSAHDYLQKSGIPKNIRVSETLELKAGAQVMMMKNMEVFVKDETRKLVNGSRGKVTEFTDVASLKPEMEKQLEELKKEREGVHEADAETEEVRRLDGRISRLTNQIAWIADQNSGVVPKVLFNGFPRSVHVFPEEFKFETVGLGRNVRSQIPLMLAWTITMHKAQGMTLSSVVAKCGKIFADGQAYVAFSRAESLRGLRIEEFSQSKIMASEVAKRFHDHGPSGKKYWYDKVPSLPTDEHADVLKKLLREHRDDLPKESLAMSRLKTKADDKWKCRVCKQSSQCCHDVKDAVERTIKRGSKRGRE
jgi:ATP-dependent DNA helicase PIF1